MNRRSAVFLALALVTLIICLVAICVAIGTAGAVGWFLTTSQTSIPTVAPAAPQSATRAPQPTPSQAGRQQTPQSSATPAAPGPGARLSTEANLATVLGTIPPLRDQIDLAIRLGRTSPLSPTPSSGAPNRIVGQVETFWVGDQDNNEHFLVTATLRYAGTNSYFYVDNTLGYDAARLKEAAEDFDSRIFPNSLKIFGNYWRPGPDGDAKLTVLNTLTPGAGGYYSSADEVPRSVNRYSNQRKMIYIDLKSYPIGSSRYGGVLSHELQHAIHWVADPGEDGWISEGLSELAMRLNGYTASRAEAAFARQPGTQLNTWSTQPAGNTEHYGASYAFMSYFLERFGETALRDLVANPARGVAGFDSVIGSRSPGSSLQDVFADWVVANYLDDPSLANGRYGYTSLDLRATPRDAGGALPGQLSGSVSQFAAQYVLFTPPTGSFDLTFAGSGDVSLAGAEAHGGDYFWWGNRGDNSDSRLTRELDLTGLSTATLSYWLWYEIEEDWDYAYLLASTDGGSTWTTIRGTHTTDTDPIGHNYGFGYTGSSSGWVLEQADLTPFAGKRVMVRFEYVTDDAVNTPGVAIDDICLVERKQCDDVEKVGAWQANGFVRATAWLPQKYIVQVIRTGGSGGSSVQRVTLDAANRGVVRLAGRTGSSERVVVVVSPVTPVTTLPASFTINVTP